jgi:drug/metabolite transporter (DMT)-like permease
MPGLATWAAILGLASLSTALAFIIFFQIVIRSGASNVMLERFCIEFTHSRRG